MSAYECTFKRPQILSYHITQLPYDITMSTVKHVYFASIKFFLNTREFLELPITMILSA